MSKFIHRGIRAAALVLCLILCISLLPACKTKNDPLAPLGFSSLEIDQNGKSMTATLRLDARTLQQHAGEWLYLYELEPGETTETAKGVRPIAAKKISSAVRFTFDLYDGERSRLYSSFVVGFEDGSVLSHDGRAVDNPEALATVAAPFLWTNAPKGLLIDDAENAADLHTSHAALELSLSQLLGGNDPLPFGGTSYTYNEGALKALDASITAATESGMQVSLRLLLDRAVDQKTAAALLSAIADRYDGDHGILSAILLHPQTLTVDGITDTGTVSRLAALCRTADLALRSHVSNGRVYVHSDFSMTDTRTFFANLQSAIEVGGAFDWGMSVLAETPLPPSAANAPAGNDAITAENLGELGDLISTSTRRGASWLSVDLAPIDALDPEAQAAAYAYHYLTAARVKPSMIFYLAHRDGTDGYVGGLYDTNGAARRLASVYDAVDRGLDDSLLSLCHTHYGKDWDPTLESIRSATLTVGNAGIGISGMGEHSLFDFREGDTHGFTAVSSLSGLSLRDSAAQGAPTLFLWTSPADTSDELRDASGIRKLLPNAAALKDALSISVHFLAQTNASDTCTLRLTLDGSAPNGTRLTYESETAVDCGSWQTATFQVSQLLTELDPTRPLVLTLTVENPPAETEPYALWFGSILVRTPEVQGFDLTPLILILGGVAIGCVGVLFIYRISTARAEEKRRRRARAAGRRGTRKG